MIHGSYTASTGLVIPIEMHCHPSGLIRRLFEEEMKRRNQIAIKQAVVNELLEINKEKECSPQKKLTD